jgi:membrane associated rhomboid family serine protease
MRRNTSIEMGFPPFRGAVRQIILASAAIFIVILLTRAFAPSVENQIMAFAVLRPETVRHGWIWQFLTYGFAYEDPLNFALAMLGVYFIGSAVQEQIGARRFTGLYFGSMVMAGVAGFLLSLTGRIAQGGASGAGAAANAILMVFFLLYRDAPVMLFPIPIQIPVKYLVLFIAAIETAYLLLSHFALFFCVVLLGLGAGYIWYKLVYRMKGTSSLSERYYGLRNSYYRWKRRRAAKKFQVYMKKHNRSVYFDEYGNYVPPEDNKKRSDDKGPWVN